MAGPSSDPLYSRVQAAVRPQFALLRLLGRGGMGAVYLARDQDLDRLVALKVLPPDAGDIDGRRVRFRREARLAAKLTHPNIVPLYSFGESDGLMYFVMGYVRGESLGDRLRREGTIPQEETRLYLAQLADALAYAHGKDVIHRDIKPDNILLDDETGQPLLADFGIASVAPGTGGTQTESGTIVGTMHYMSPEQATGVVAVDGRSDLYSIGVVGYVMLAGQTPFDAPTFSSFVTQQAAADPPPLAARVSDVAPDLAAAIMRCLAKDPASRWPDARAFKHSLGAAVDDDSERLPGELREIAGALFWSAAGGWMTGSLVARFLAPALGWAPALVAALLPAVVYLGTAAVHTRKGFSWTEMRRVALWPPSWWPFWWPPAWRRPEDLWNRLPPVVRRVRILYGVLAVMVFLALPLALAPPTRFVFFGVFGLAWIALTATMLFVAWWAHRSDIPNNADLRSLFLRSSADRRFWKRPQMASRLLPAGARPSRTAPAAPADYARRIVEDAQRTTGVTRDAALLAADVARRACASLEDLDRAIAALGTGVGSDELPGTASLTARREGIAKGLETLWREHANLLSENSAEGAQRLTELARLLDDDVAVAAGRHQSGDSETIGATCEPTMPPR